MLRRALVLATTVAVAFVSACAPETGTGPTPPTAPPASNQTVMFVYSGPRGNCDMEKVMVGAHIRPCQGLANGTASVIVNSKVLDPACVDFYGYYAVTTVTGAAQQGTSTKQLVLTDNTPGTPVLDTGFNVDNGPITVTITNLTVDTSTLQCGWFGIRAD